MASRLGWVSKKRLTAQIDDSLVSAGAKKYLLGRAICACTRAFGEKRPKVNHGSRSCARTERIDADVCLHGCTLKQVGDCIGLHYARVS